MDRAARAMRRSGVKLLSLGAGHADLNVVISESREIKNSMKAFMTAQNSGVQYLMKWAMNEENVVIQDACSMMMEINAMWTEVQNKFIEHLREFRRMLEAVLEGERRLDQSKANVASCEQREVKLRKELKKAARRATLEDLNHLENKIAQCQRQKDQARVEMEAHRRENEATKHVHFKEGMLRVSEAYAELGHKTSILFESQATVAINMPDTIENEGEPNSGYVAAKESVMLAREKLHQYNRENYMYRADANQGPAEAPPPYDPGDYFTAPGEGSPSPAPDESQPPLTPRQPQPSTSAEALSTHDRPTSPVQRTKSLPPQPERPPQPVLPRHHSLPSRHRPPLPSRPPRSYSSHNTGDPPQENLPSATEQLSHQSSDTNTLETRTRTSSTGPVGNTTSVSSDDPPEYSLAVPGTSSEPPSLASLASKSVPIMSADAVSSKPTPAKRSINDKKDPNKDQRISTEEKETSPPETETLDKSDSVKHSGEGSEEEKVSGAIGGLSLFD